MVRRHYACSVVAAVLLAAGFAARPAPAQVVGATVLVESAPEGVAVNPTTRRIYVANGGSQSISVIDAISNVVVGSIKVAANPRRIALNPTTNRLYVVHQGGNSLSVIDGNRNALEGVIPVGDTPVAVAVNPTANRVYVATAANGRVVVIDGAVGTVLGGLAVGATPKELAVNPTTNRLYVVNTDGTMASVDTASDQVSDAVQPKDLGVVSGAAVNPANNRIYLAQQDKNAVAVLDGASGKVVESVAIPAPDAVAVNPTNNRVFVTSGTGGTVTVIDGGINKIVTTIPVAGKALGVAVNPATGRAYATLQDRNAVAVIGLDFIAPAVETAVAPEPNAAGWNNADVTVNLKATDNTNGSGVKQLTVVTTGAQATAPATIDGDNTSVKIVRDGPTTLVFRALDGEGNAALERSLTIYVDKTPPKPTVTAYDGIWSGNDVSIPVTVADFGSGLLRSEDAVFSLVAKAKEGEENADLSTDSREIEDVAGNKVTVGPVKGIKIDKKAPIINLASPTQRVFKLRQPVTADVVATDGGSGVASLVSAGLQNGRLDTAAVGPKSFAITAKDKVGNEATQTINYQVAYDVRLAYSPNIAVKRGKKMTLKLQLRDAGGTNVSSSTILLTAHRIDSLQPNGIAPVSLGRPFDFRRVEAGHDLYALTVSTRDLIPGRYVVAFTAGKDPYVYTAPFSVR